MFDTKNAKFGEPNDRVWNDARRFRNAVVIGQDSDGKTHILSTSDQRSTEALVREAVPGLLEPAA